MVGSRSARLRPTPLLALALLCVPPPATAQPEVSVRARSTLHGVRVEGAGRALTVRGALRDNLNQPIPSAPIEVSIDGGPSARARTGGDGVFRIPLEFDRDGRYAATVRFAGSSLLAAAEVELPIRVGRRTLHLDLRAPAVARAERPIPIEARASVDGGAPVADTALELVVGDAGRRAARTDANGVARWTLRGLPRGRHDLAVTAAGDARHLPARAEATVRVARPLSIELRYVGEHPPAPGTDLPFEGVVGAEGVPAPPAGTDVVLTADGAPVGDAVVDALGRFRARVDPADVEPGRVRFRALTEAPEETWLDATSNTVPVDVPVPPPPSPVLVWAPLGLGLLALLGLVWRRGALRPSRRTQPEPQPSSQPARAAPSFEVVDRPRRAARSTRLRIRVEDALTGAQLAATVVLGADAPPPPHHLEPPRGHAVPAEPGGAPGAYVLERRGAWIWAGAPGYAPECHRCPRLDGGTVIVRLLPVAARIEAIYREVLAAAGRPPLRFGRQTPREAARPLGRRGAPSGETAALTELVEAACFDVPARVAADPAAALLQAHELADTVRASLGGAG